MILQKQYCLNIGLMGLLFLLSSCSTEPRSQTETRTIMQRNGAGFAKASILSPEDADACSSWILRNALQHAKEWRKVRAAEALLALGIDAEKVEEIFMAEEESVPEPCPYRVGVLRVLYRCGNQKEDRLMELRSIAFGKQPHGRIHAVETLAKLCIKCTEAENKSLYAFTKGENKLLAEYSAWLLACGTENSEGLRLLTRFLESEQPTTAAYAFYNLKSLPDVATVRLEEIVNSKDEAPITRVFAAMALVKHKKFSTKQVDAIVKNTEIFSDDKARRFLVLLLPYGRISDSRVTLRNLLQDSSEDVRIQAAYVQYKFSSTFK